MDEPKKPDASPDESLANVPPAPPGIVDLPSVAIAVFETLSIITLAGGAGFVFLFSVAMTTTMGATRSARLQWADRQDQIAQAVRDSQIDSPCEEIVETQSDVSTSSAAQD